MNKNTAQRIFQLKSWQARRRALGQRPRIEALPSVARAPVNAGNPLVPCLGLPGRLADSGAGHGLPHPAVLGWQLLGSAKVTTAAAALEQALITGYGMLGILFKTHVPLEKLQPTDLSGVKA